MRVRTHEPRPGLSQAAGQGARRSSLLRADRPYGSETSIRAGVALAPSYKTPPSARCRKAPSVRLSPTFRLRMARSVSGRALIRPAVWFLAWRLVAILVAIAGWLQRHNFGRARLRSDGSRCLKARP